MDKFGRLTEQITKAVTYGVISIFVLQQHTAPPYYRSPAVLKYANIETHFVTQVHSGHLWIDMTDLLNTLPWPLPTDIFELQQLSVEALHSYCFPGVL